MNALSSPYRTGSKYQVLWALPEVCDLAKDVLDLAQLEEAEEVASMLASNKQKKREALFRLREVVEPPPKRPLYYAQHELEYLPRWTRDGIRYLGDYIDLLVKAMTFEFTKDPHCVQRSLGINVNALSPKKYGVPLELINKLKKYNSFLYQPGKHDFSLPKGRSHRFTSREAVLTAYITMRLAEDIKAISPLATKVSLDRADLAEIAGLDTLN